MTICEAIGAMLGIALFVVFLCWAFSVVGVVSFTLLMWLFPVR